MLHLVCKSIVHGGFSIPTSQAQKLFLFRLQSSSLFVRKCFASNANQSSFVASYYINKCGFSPEYAVSASKFAHFDSPDKADAVLAFLKSHGFSERQVSQMIKKAPQLLRSNPEKTLLPKLEFFYSRGASKYDVTRICSGYSAILHRSLDNRIIPTFEFFRDFLGSDEKVIKAFRRQPCLITETFLKSNLSKVDTLRKIGVPKSNIASLIVNQPGCILWSATRFNEILLKIKNMGLNPLRISFVFAVAVMGMLSENTWGRKIDAYRKWGLSEEEILMAFGKFPWFMDISEDKIAAVMNVYVNQLGMEPAVIARNPATVGLSLRKRIIPRASVAQALVSKGFLKKDFGIGSFFLSTEKLFLKKYVIPYEGEDSKLLKLYNEKLNSAG